MDEVAAEHVSAEAVVHYGPACLSPCRKLPVLHVFGRQQLDVMRCAEAFKELYPDLQSHVVVLSDVAYSHAMGETRWIAIWNLSINAFLCTCAGMDMQGVGQVGKALWWFSLAHSDPKPYPFLILYFPVSLNSNLKSLLLPGLG